jgi:hypothetical protein
MWLGMQAGQALQQARWLDPRRIPAYRRKSARIAEAAPCGPANGAQRRRRARKEWDRGRGVPRVRGAAAAAAAPSVRCCPLFAPSAAVRELLSACTMQRHSPADPLLSPIDHAPFVAFDLIDAPSVAPSRRRPRRRLPARAMSIRSWLRAPLLPLGVLVPTFVAATTPSQVISPL